MRKALILVAACLFLISGTSVAQMKFGVGPHVGISFSSMGGEAVGTVKPSDIYGMGFNFGAQGEMELTKNIGVRMALDYAMFSSDKKKLGLADGYSGLNINMFSVMFSGVGKLPLHGGFTPYGVLGFGLHFSGASDLTYNGQLVAKAGDSSTNFGMNFGAGAEYKVSKMIGVFGEFKVLLIFSSGSSTTVLPLAFGANFWL